MNIYRTLSSTIASGKLNPMIIVLVFVLLTLTAHAQEQESTNVQLVIPEADIAAFIVDIPLNNVGSWDMTGVERNVGHLQGTAWINAPGNIALAGHLETEEGTPGVFAHLEELTAGDVIMLILPDGTRRSYRVEAISTTATDDLTPIYPTLEDRLTLITCYTFDAVSSIYLERLVVSAVRVPYSRIAQTPLPLP
jgi:sortase A